MRHVQRNRIDFWIFPDYTAMSHHAARIIVELIRSEQSPLICLASGSTPRLAYELIPGMCRKEDAAVNYVRFVKLDEWLGLPEGATGTCEEQLTEQLIGPLGLPRDRYISFSSSPEDPLLECSRISAELDAQGPIHLAVLGLGRNGHLGFNEPDVMLVPGCHEAVLTPASRDHPMVRDNGSIPTRGITLGIADILHARRILLLASGESKKEQMCRIVSNQVDPRFPASFLQLHPAVTCVCDEDAASLLDSTR